jgi:guanyl-specific ribonuclease Sa
MVLPACFSLLVSTLSWCSSSPSHSMTAVSQVPHTPSMQLQSGLRPASVSASRIDLPAGTGTVLPLLAHTTSKPLPGARGGCRRAVKRSMWVLAQPSCAQNSSKALSMGVGPQQ